MLFEAVAMYDYDPYVSCIVYVIFLVLYVGITLFIGMSKSKIVCEMTRMDYYSNE